MKVIRGFFAHLPAEVDPSTREAADADLAHKASGYRPDELAKYAQRIMDWLNPDGELSDQERAPASAGSFWASRNSTVCRGSAAT